jgi:hypothetical protein
MTFISIIGLPRSGTTLLGKLFSRCNNVSYFEEPNVIWRRGLAKHKTDILKTNLITASNKEYIRDYFFKNKNKNKNKNENENELIVEKTPNNCLRVEYVEAIVPEAKFIFLLRNPVDIYLSSLKKWKLGIDANNTKVNGNKSETIVQFNKAMQLSINDFIYYIPKAFESILFRLGIGTRKHWGPMYPGFKEIRRVSSDEVSCSYQVLSCMQHLTRSAGGVIPTKRLFITYYDLINNPNLIFEHIQISFKIDLKGINDVLQQTEFTSKAEATLNTLEEYLKQESIPEDFKKEISCNIKESLNIYENLKSKYY